MQAKNVSMYIYGEPKTARVAESRMLQLQS